MKQFISYCPNNFEDIILSVILSDIGKGFYIDVGANNPIRENVTKHFYDSGWRGINIEPLKEEFDLLLNDRPRDINLNIGVSNKKDNLEFYVSGELTTCAQDVIDKNKDKKTCKKEVVPVERLSDILDECITENTEINFCKIDVEGFERSVLEGLDFTKYRPQVFCIESIDPIEQKPSYNLWEDILANNNYVLLFSYRSNRYYADKQNESYCKISKKFNIASNSNIPSISHINGTVIKILISALKSIWHLLPYNFRINTVLPYRTKYSIPYVLKLRCSRLLRKLNADYDVRFHIIK
ncbi:MAG: FkbM family methyltransferase [Endomicrobia bacterium]|nr:FkbM family methyltransferase [Endomicrobiia bacterium]